jgi:hypothetical protein
MNLPSSIEQIQPDVLFKLLSEPLFANIAIFKIREKRLDSQVNQSLAGLGGTRADGGAVAGGLTIEVLMPTLSQPIADAPGPVCFVAQKFIIKEQPTINLGANGVGVTAEQCAQNIIQTFHLYAQGGATAGLQTWYAADPCYRYVDAGKNSDGRDNLFLMVEVTMNAKLALPVLVTVQAPGATQSEGNVTLIDTEEGGGSTIYYTTDGSFPGPANATTAATPGTALVYTAPFAASAGAVIRAASWNTAVGQGSPAITYVVT